MNFARMMFAAQRNPTRIENNQRDAQPTDFQLLKRKETQPN